MSAARLLVDVCPLDGGETVCLEGTAKDLFPLLSSYLARNPSGVCLSYPYGAGGVELRLMPGRSLAVNLAEAWNELNDIGGPPPCFDGGQAEADAALYLLRALIDAGPQIR